MSGDGRGAVIAVEGVEGSGKTTLLRGLAGRLEGNGTEVLQLREPGGTVLGEEIRDILLHRDTAVTPEAELFLFMASRAQLAREKIIPAVSRGRTVLLDRYLLSSVAYQGGAGGLGLETVIDIGKMAVRGAEPDLTILLDLEPEAGFRRFSGSPLDRIEKKGMEYHEKVRRAYLEAARIFPWLVRVVRADRSPEEVLETAWEAVRAIL